MRPPAGFPAVKLLVLEDQAAVTGVAADKAAKVLVQAVHERGRCLLGLSGGMTPLPVYDRLASREYDGLPWPRVHLLWVDERAVPPGDDHSNFRLARSSGLLRRELAGVHRMRAEAAPEEAAAEYEQVLGRLTGSDDHRPDPLHERRNPTLDLCIMGMGEDGHTASLFPGASEIDERERWVVATGEQAGFRRLTLTLPVLAASGRLLFLVTGEGKAEALRAVLSGQRSDLPMARLLEAATSATLLVDRSAASRLDREALPR
jgi:6-phosphogluconolactonase